ncbi:hypothetical protein L1D50_21415 [Pseudoalteromonas sp. Isolate6]|uniref:hypothetical protein n=1 Tax=Pseudoalteromonas sp. Isolate6 TaxID=2908527 RepID=UPI001EFE8549|nr:hypothetical protein [Pseudoalteromonas sp. Isolate6]MCG9761633.1 hypothetical protein [Pseudoalteromonas sp. Isolate6]
MTNENRETLQQSPTLDNGQLSQQTSSHPLPNQTSSSSDIGKSIWLVPIYVFIYSTFAIWFLVDGWLTGFSSILKLWHISDDTEIPAQVPFLFFTIVGSLFGCGILGITSFHRHYAISCTFEKKHIWGFYLAPLLSTLVGCLVFAIVQSGLLVLTGDIADENDPVRATLGYVAIGGVAGYNWDVFIKKLENLSRDILNSGE